jgi:hypothetical protein
MRINKCYLTNYGGGVFLRVGKMNTKKLVLGFCSLAAVTGSAPQVFGDNPVSAAEVQWREALSQRDAVYVKKRDAMKREIGAKIQKIADMGNDEARYVATALLCEHRAHLLYNISISEFEEKSELYLSLQNELVEAIEVADRTNAKFLRFTQKMKAANRVEALQLRLADVLADLERISLKANRECRIYTVEAQKFRRLAREMRDRRLGKITEFVDTDIAACVVVLRADMGRVVQLNSAGDVTEADEMCLRHARYVEFLNMGRTLFDIEYTIAVNIDKIFSHPLRSDLRWLMLDCYSFNENESSSYCHKPLDYDHNCSSRVDAQKNQIESVFEGIYDLQNESAIAYCRTMRKAFFPAPN